MSLGAEARRFDEHLASDMGLDDRTRESIWNTVDGILQRGPQRGSAPGATGLALGYVQSGKTTSITALVAAAADEGYRVIVALLGTTNLLLDQNADRIESALGIGDRRDYRWVSLPSPRGAKGVRALVDWVAKDRIILIPVLKHSGRLHALADVLVESGAGELPALIVDDEADQASLNTKVVQRDSSETYAAISRLRQSLPEHLYLQYTATPYAPLLLAADDALRPDFVEMVHPGPGYTGGREFFVDHADRVVRPIPTVDEQAPRGLPTMLPTSLVEALGSFVAGAAMLLGQSIDNAPVSMLVHSTHKNDVQQRYHFLIERTLRRWRKAAESARRPSDLPSELTEERRHLVEAGADDLSDHAFLEQATMVLREATAWLVNSTSDVRKIDWNVAPIHLLVGGNKLDRGFTIEGLTVTYMNRPASTQIDTLEQRARAFGYREDLLPYCQFFAGPRTLEVLRGVVFTEYDLRAQLEDWVESGGSVADWAREIGLIIPAGTKPSRDAVLDALHRFNQGRAEWHGMRRPNIDTPSIAANSLLVESLGLMDAPPRDFGRLSHRTLEGLTAGELLEQLIQPWQLSSYSPGWRDHEIQSMLTRDGEAPAVVMLLERPGGGPRDRKWDPELGFVNLFQGADLERDKPGPNYPGDREVFPPREHPDLVVVQVHRVMPREVDVDPRLMTLAIRLPTKTVVRRAL